RGPVPPRKLDERSRQPGGGAAPDVRGHHTRAPAPVSHPFADPPAARTDALQPAQPLLRRIARGLPEVAHAQGRGPDAGLGRGGWRWWLSRRGGRPARVDAGLALGRRRIGTHTRA